MDYYEGRVFSAEEVSGEYSPRDISNLAFEPEAWELSFVPVGAQPRAGTHKSVGFNKPIEEIEEETPKTETKNTENEKILFFLYYEKDVMIIIIYSKVIFINVLYLYRGW